MTEPKEKKEEKIANIEFKVRDAKNEIVKVMEEQYPEVKHSDGKKLRGSLAVIMSDCFGGDHKKAVNYGAAIEFIHSGSLVHDDVLDSHETRRGKPTAVITEGIKKALLTGDIMFTNAIKMGAEAGSEEARTVAKAMEGTLKGAIKEMSLSNILDDMLLGKLEDDLYYKIIDLKTATLFGCSAQFGMLSYTDKKTWISDAYSYGLYVGRAYQIADDLVDIVNMAEGKKKIIPVTVVPMIPAILKYQKDFLKTLPFKAMVGRIGLSTIMDSITELDLTDKMISEIKSELKQAESFVDDYGEAIKDDCVLKQYPKFAINKMLEEIGESI
ncbi:MAG: polyprenyl synthetase family protein [Candidatus Methanoperedens sp.]|nr:polyprenyl synthetase family protein [Candidatus Methanoperedens sp.]